MKIDPLAKYSFAKYNRKKLGFNRQVVADVIQFGKKTIVHKRDFSPPEEILYYLDNMFVYASIEDELQILRIFENRNKNKRLTLQVFMDQSHNKLRMLERVITQKEIEACIANGWRVCEYKTHPKTGWKHYNWRWFYNDVCVIGKFRYGGSLDVSTAYRITPAARGGFLETLPHLMKRFKIGNCSFASATIVDYTQCQEMLPQFRHTLAFVERHFKDLINEGKFPDADLPEWAQKLSENDKFKLKLKALKETFLNHDLNYPFYSTNPTRIVKPMGEFNAISNHEYILVFKFEVHNKNKISKKQTTLLKRIGFDMNKVPHEKQFIEDDDNYYVKIGFNMKYFSAAPQPWSFSKTKSYMPA